MRIALLIALAILATTGAWAQRPSVFIQPARWVPISRAMTLRELCRAESHARTIREATAHDLRCELRFP